MQVFLEFPGFQGFSVIQCLLSTFLSHLTEYQTIESLPYPFLYLR